VIVISDTSVISGLIKIRKLSLLQKVFSEVIIPPEVQSELKELERFDYDLSIFKKADWILIRTPEDKKLIAQLEQVLDRGEAEAIALAKELKADFVLIDEKKGRSAAEQQGLNVVGLIGILVRAKRLNFIVHIKPLLDGLIKHNFRISSTLYESVLKKVGEWENGS